MEFATMGRVTTIATIRNYDDQTEAELGRRLPSEVRTIEVADALVDTGTSLLSLPKRLVQELGLRRLRTKVARTPGGNVRFNIFSPVTLTIQGRECLTEVCEVADECPVLVGQIPLELLDFLVDPVGQRLMGNPAHNGEQMIEMF
jgi:predicted aspartyl protease